MSQPDRRHIPLHDHSSFRQGGKLDLSDAISGGIPAVTGGPSAPGGGTGTTDISGLVTKIRGGLETVDAHGSPGATVTLDIGTGNWHSLTLTADCTVTVSGFTAATGCSVLVKVTQDGTGGWAITWDSDIVFAGDDQPAQGIGEVSWFILVSDEGDGTIYGFPVGGGGSPATTVESETTLGISSAVGTDTEYARQDHTHGTPDADAISAAGRWEVLMDGASPPAPLESGSGTDWLYVWVT